MHCSSFKLAGLLFIGLILFGVTRTGVAQSGRSFDAKRYFERLDRNGDGRLDKSELNSKAVVYLRRIGVDVNDDRIRLRAINQKLEQNQKSSQEQFAQQEKTKLTQRLKVPAFGAPVEEYTVDQFGGGTDEGQAIEFNETTLKMVEYVLRQYDKNQDNVIDLKEREQARWGRPDPNESDLNKDGLLTRDELLRRYHVRQLEQAKQRKVHDQRSRGSDAGRTGGGRRDDRSNGRDRDESGRSRGSGRSAATNTTTRSGSRSNEKDRESYERYSKSLISRYDTNNDNRLSEEEWKSVRRKPANADENKDGFVSQREYANALMKAASAKSNPALSVSNSTPRVETESSTGGGRKELSNNTDMTKLDANSDAQVQMHEYSTEWDDGKLAEFYAIDKNHDGVITESEWRSR